MEDPLFLGVDAGSTSLDAVLVDPSGAVVASAVVETRGRTVRSLSDAAGALLAARPGAVVAACAVTGSGRAILAPILDALTLNEITAHAIGTGPLLPDSTPCSLVEIGGQDSKFLTLARRGESVEVQDYTMNTLCAAGTGTFFDGQAERLGLGIEEFSTLAASAARPAQVAGRCVVFAKTDIIHHQQRGTPLDEIAFGLCRAAARNIIGTLARGRTVHRPVFFTGGVAANRGMVRALREELGLPEGQPVVPSDHRVLGAVGAALWARDHSRREARPLAGIADRAREHVVEAPAAPAAPPHRPTGSWALGAVSVVHTEPLTPAPGLAVGLDLGSVSVKWVLVEDGRIVDSHYAYTKGRPVQALSEAALRLRSSKVLAGRPIRAIGVTGSGRKLAARLLHADLAVNEITAHARAMRVLDPEADTLFEIGGQDAKFVRFDGARIADFALNTACSAGTGSLLLEESVRLGLSVSDLDYVAGSSSSSLELHDRCTVFIDSDLVSRMQAGTPVPDLAAGMLRAVARNYLDRVVGHRSIGKRIVFAGGVSRSSVVRAELERILDRPVTASPWGALSGAIGAAIIAGDRAGAGHDPASLSIPAAPDASRTIECRGCGGTCSVTRLSIEPPGRAALRLFTGDACGRWSDRTDAEPDPDEPQHRDNLFESRARLYGMDAGVPPLEAGTVGILRAQQYWDLYPMIRVLLADLGLGSGLSSVTTRRTIERGIALSRAEQCMPVKVAIAHADEILDRGASALLVPAIGEYPQAENLTSPESDRLLPCLYSMQLGPVLRATLREKSRLRGVPVLAPSLNLHPELEGYTVKSLERELSALGSYPTRRIRSALRAAVEHHRSLRRTSESLGLPALGSSGPVVVVFGRPYTLYDPVLNIQLAERIRRLGLTPVPFDTILSAGTVPEHLSFMQWKMGADHLRAATAMVPHPDAYPLFLTYYGCGPDAFISKYFAEILGDRPSLSLELDGHSAEAGLETRLEAFADAMRSGRGKRTVLEPPRPARSPSLLRGRTVALPYFSDTVHAFAGALERAGMKAHVMPLADEHTRLLGERLSNGRECNPYSIILGDLVRWARDPSLPNSEKGFFITSARGPCLLTHYAPSFTRVLRQLGFEDVLVWNPYGNELLDVLSLSELVGLWHGMLGTDYVFRWSCTLRPYETVPGAADEARMKALALIREGVRSGRVIPAIRSAVSIMESVPNDRASLRPGRIKVGVVGDLYTRINSFANQNLYRTLEDLGCEVLAPPFMIDGQLYDLWDHPFQYYIHGHYPKALKRALLSLYQVEETHRIRRLFPPDPAITFDSFGLARRRQTDTYFSSHVDGYLAQNLGKAIDFIEIGAHGILNVMCHNCMVGLTSDAVVDEVRADHGHIPFMSIAYDSLGDVHVRTRIEAFVDMLRARAR